MGLATFQWWLGAAMLVATGIGALAAIVPMVVGIRAFARMEF